MAVWRGPAECGLDKHASRIPLQLTLAHPQSYPIQAGSFADRQVKRRRNHSNSWRAQFSQNLLRPGQYARIQCVDRKHTGALLVPSGGDQQQGKSQVTVWPR